MAASEYDEETATFTQVPPSGQQKAYEEERVALMESPVYRVVSSEVEIIEPQQTEEYLIYSSKDQQQFLEQYGKEEDLQGGQEIR